MSTETNLVLGNLIIPLGAGREITQTLQPISNGDIRRTVNGDLIDLTRIENRKFESSISTTDQASPTLAGIWKGTQLIVECISPLYELVDPILATHTIIRNPVISSIQGYDAANTKVVLISATGIGNRDLLFVSPVSFIMFRPILTMLVLGIQFNRDEYAAEEGWTIDMEEV